MKKTTKFLNEFIFNIESAPVTLKQSAKYHLTKALRAFFNNRHIYNLTEKQVFSIILKVKFSDGSIKSLSTLRKGDRTAFRKLSTLFKQLLMIRSEDYSELKVEQIIFSYHIYSKKYVDLHKDSLITDDLLTENSNDIICQEINNIKFMAPSNLFKLPLLYAGSIDFLLKFKELNPDVTDIYNLNNYKYRIIFESISFNETSIKIVLQSDPSLTIYQFKDKLITVPRLDQNEFLIERTLFNKLTTVYLIDSITYEILLVKKED